MFYELDKKWQKEWNNRQIFKTKETGKKFYNLEMFPYPSGYLHIGHLRNYVYGDVSARFYRLKGYSVLYPMGYDSFGLPAENAAIENKEDPYEFTLKRIEGIKEQQKKIGLSYDWSKQVITCLPEYYKWNQWFFIKFFEKKLAYRKEANANWCNKCQTVLANEQVQNGKCWRCGTIVEQKKMSQWFLKTTEYAEQLLDDLENLNWPERVKQIQRNWIGKSQGTEIFFSLENGKKISIFTTRIDTIFGVTFVVMAPENPLIEELIKPEKKQEFEKLLEETKKQTDLERQELKEKKGLFTGSYAINPMTNKKIPIFVGNFVVYGYGGDAVMSVPAHDERDFEFAKKYSLPIKVVIQPEGKELKAEEMKTAFVEDGIMFNSGEFTGMKNREAIEKINKWLEEKELGKRKTNYRLKDWLVSRQRYFGTPIPFIYCEKCGMQPVPYSELPVQLPKDIEFGKGNPLETSQSFLKAKCPKCGKEARRETDTMDTFFDSSWYFLRYLDSQNKEKPFEKEKADYWMPVDLYIGGIEHAAMHLIYARFFTKVLKDLGLLEVKEPFKKLFTQGMVNAPAPFCESCNIFLKVQDGKEGKCKKCGKDLVSRSTKMSKSLGNTVSPQELFEKYGADTTRLTILIAADPEKDFDWTEKGVEFAYKQAKKLWESLQKQGERTEENIEDTIFEGRINILIREITKAIEKQDYRNAGLRIIDAINEYDNYIDDGNKKIAEEYRNKLCIIINPFMPHISEEIWSINNKGYSSLQIWPKEKEEKIKEYEKLEQIYTLQEDISQIEKLVGKTSKKIKLIVSEDWKYSLLKEISSKEKFMENRREIISKFPEKGKEVNAIMEKIAKNPKLLNSSYVSQVDEIISLQKLKNLLEREVIIEKEQESSEPKAKAALPKKPSILIID